MKDKKWPTDQASVRTLNSKISSVKEDGSEQRNADQKWNLEKGGLREERRQHPAPFQGADAWDALCISCLWPSDHPDASPWSRFPLSQQHSDYDLVSFVDVPTWTEDDHKPDCGNCLLGVCLAWVSSQSWWPAAVFAAEFPCAQGLRGEGSAQIRHHWLWGLGSQLT